MNFPRIILTTTLALAIFPGAQLPAQTPAASQPAVGQPAALPPIDKPLPFGAESLDLPGGVVTNKTSPRTADLLAAELARPGVPHHRRAELVADLAATKLPNAIGPVISAAVDTSPVVRATVAAALGELAETQPSNRALVETVGRLVVDGDATVRAAAIRSAAVVGRGDLVTAGLNDADLSVVATALTVAGADAAVGIAARIADSDASLSALAIDATARNNLATSADAITARLRATDAPLPVLVSGLRALGTLKATSHGQVVVGFLSHAHPSVRREATAALSEVLPADDARQRGIAMLADADESVRATAAVTLGRVPGAATVAPLVKALSDPYTPLHDAARQSLVAAGAPAARAAAALLDDADPRPREDGSYVLGALASREGYARHVELLKDADWRLVAQVAGSLGQIGGDPATVGPELIYMFNRAIGPDGVTDNKASPWIGTAAAHALRSGAMLGYTPTGDAGKRIISKKMMPADARAAAIWAVGIVGCTNPGPVFNSFRAILSDIEEGSDVKFEAIKAVGNLKFKPAAGLLDAAGPMEATATFAALIHWSRDRLNGTATPFIPPAEAWQANVSITDLAP
jgi:HEAT repeat protein